MCRRSTQTRMQIFYSQRSKKLFVRTRSNDVWGRWKHSGAILDVWENNSCKRLKKTFQCDGLGILIWLLTIYIEECWYDLNIRKHKVHSFIKVCLCLHLQSADLKRSNEQKISWVHRWLSERVQMAFATEPVFRSNERRFETLTMTRKNMQKLWKEL